LDVNGLTVSDIGGGLRGVVSFVSEARDAVAFARVNPKVG
jgi:hypothetical protein